MCAGNILDNLELIATLENAKAQAVDISQKLGRSKITAREIDEVRAKYTPAAKRGAILFFVMASLSNITNMYEYSLKSFLTVFSMTLSTSRKDPNLDARLKHIVEAATFNVYNYTCLGLFEKHKLMFSFEMAIKIADGACPPSQILPCHFLGRSCILERMQRIGQFSSRRVEAEKSVQFSVQSMDCQIGSNE